MVQSGIVPNSPMIYNGTRVQDGTLGWARACVVHSGIVPNSPMMYHGTRVQDGTLGWAI